MLHASAIEYILLRATPAADMQSELWADGNKVADDFDEEASPGCDKPALAEVTVDERDKQQPSANGLPPQC